MQLGHVVPRQQRASVDQSSSCVRLAKCSLLHGATERASVHGKQWLHCRHVIILQPPSLRIGASHEGQCFRWSRDANLRKDRASCREVGGGVASGASSTSPTVERLHPAATKKSESRVCLHIGHAICEVGFVTST